MLIVGHASNRGKALDYARATKNKGKTLSFSLHFTFKFFFLLVVTLTSISGQNGESRDNVRLYISILKKET